MRLFRSICAVIGSICAAILLFLPGSRLAGQTAARPYSVRGPRATPEMVLRMERTRAILVEGWKITPAEAVQLEEKLAKDSEDLALRLRLMSYYVQQVMHEKHAAHVVWLIQNHPDAEAFWDASIITRMPVTDGDGKASANESRVQALWKEQANRLPSNAKVLRNAAYAVAVTEPALALQYVKAARQAEPGNAEWITWLAKTYADAIRWTYWDERSMMAFTGDTADYRHLPVRLPLPMCQSVRKEVETSTDAALIGAVGDMLIREARLLAREGNPATDVEQAARFGEALAERARALRAMAAGR